METRPTPGRHPIIDAHIHLWDQRRTPRKGSPLVKALGWRKDLMLWVARKVFPQDQIDFYGVPDHVLSDYLPPHYRSDASAREVVGVVHVQAGWEAKGPLGPVGETRWLEHLATPLLRGIVGYADLGLGAAVGPVLDAHAAASERFRGIRYMLAHHPDKRVHSYCADANRCRDPAWRAGYAQLAERGLSFDAWIYAHQLGEITALAREFPEVPVILDHGGGPVGIGGPFAGIGPTAAHRADAAERWRDGIRALAELPHVSVKLSGLAMPLLGWGYHARAQPPEAAGVAADLGPLVTFLIETFGVARCMFASNFPVDKASMSWSTLVDAFERILADRTDAERRALFHDNAARIYRLDL